MSRRDRHPSSAVKVRLSNEHLRELKAGTQLVRIYDTCKATDPDTGTRMYSGISYNPYQVPDTPGTRGRYSSRRVNDPTEQYSYLYFGEAVEDERCVIAECINLLGLGRSSDNSRRIIDIDDLNGLSFVYAHLKRPVTLLDITTRENADKFGADFAILQGGNYKSTRQWARFFRETYPTVEGLAYTPVPHGTSEHGVNIVLFSDLDSDGDHSPISREHSEVDLLSKSGQATLRRLEVATNISVNRGIA